MVELNGRTIYICIPTRGQINMATCQWLTNTLKQPFDGYDFEVNFSKMDPTDCNRNRMVMAFLADPKNEWLLFVDDDMLPRENLLTMIRRGKKVISGLTCVMQEKFPSPLLMKRTVSDGKNCYRMMTVAEIGDINDPLIEVDGVGAGCLLIHREVLEKIGSPWFLFQKDEDGLLEKSEDYYFSDKVTSAGYKLFVDTEVVVGHLKQTDLVHIATLLYGSKISKIMP